MTKSSHSKGTCTSSKVEALDAIEKIMKPETLQLYTTWCKEKYAIESDELCVVRSQLLLEDELTTEPKPRDREDTLLALLSKKQQKVSCMYHEPMKQKQPLKQGKGTSSMRKYLASEEVIAYLEEKKQQKKREAAVGEREEADASG